MPIRVQCQCGSTLQAEDRFAGSRALCPYCRRTLILPGQIRVPTAAPSPSPSPSPAPPPAAAPTPVPDRNASQAPAAAPHRADLEPLDVYEFLEDPVVAAATASSPDARDAAPRTAAPPPPFGGAAASSTVVPPTPPVAKTPWTRRMFLALLDPRAIQWLLVVGGGLMVVGLLIWLASLKLFENAYVIAAALGVASLAVHGGGCLVMLRTSHKTAGRALTFLGCVVLPLNLWYYEYQDILTLEGHLWLAAFVICWIFIGTVYLLRDALFLYAVEAGVTLTALLLMASLGHLSDVTYLSLTLLTLALVSIHAERAFPADAAVFSRRQFGLNLFWSGHAQLAAGLAFLLTGQAIRWFTTPVEALLGIQWSGPLVESKYVAGAVWLLAMYAYIYSDLVVRRIGLYTYLAAICLLMAEVTLVGLDLPAEALIALLSVTAVAVNVALATSGERAERMRRTLPPLSVLVSFLAVALGIVLHFRATSAVLREFEWGYPTAWGFVGAMLVVAVGNRVSAFLERDRDPHVALTYILFSASGVILGAAGVLRNLQFVEWHHQAPVLMIIPILYLLASVLRTERAVRGPLQWAAHAATAVILGSVVGGSLDLVEKFVEPISGRVENLLAGVVFIEAALFYSLAAIIRRKQLNVYLATIAACGAVWEFIGYSTLPGSYYTLLYAVLGVVLLIVSRFAGLAERTVYQKDGGQEKEVTGPGASFFLAGNAVLVMAFLAATLQGVTRLLTHQSSTENLVALVLTTIAGAVATVLTGAKPQRWWHATGTVVLAGLSFATFNILLDIPVWRKAEAFFAIVGVVILVASYIARFREDEQNDMVSIGLWLGSALAAISLLTVVLWQRITSGPSLPDELALVTVTMLMLASGAGLQFKAPTLFGVGALGLYLATVIVHLAYSPQVAVGVYLAIGGSLVFVVGVVLSIFRDRLIALPDRIANREGLFRIINWR